MAGLELYGQYKNCKRIDTLRKLEKHVFNWYC